MKEKLVGKFIHISNPSHNRGFSTLELMIAMTLMSMGLVGAVSANYAAQYWSITSETSNEGLYKAKTKLEDMRSLVKQDFYQIVSTPPTISQDPSDPADASCIKGGLCYSVQTIVTDLSSCSKYIEARVSWQIYGYPETTTSLYTNLTNSSEATALGGDCILNQPGGSWASAAPQIVGSLTFSPGKLLSSIDTLHKKIYVTAATSPYLLAYAAPTSVGQSPSLLGSIGSTKLNDIDVEKDLATGRTYAFVAKHSTTLQLSVYDVTDPAAPSLVTEKKLKGIIPPGVFSEGWKVFVYGGRLYMTTRETSGNEFHIFNIDTPAQPIEIGTGFQLNRTVNDVVVREQKVGGVVHRFAFLAADADTSELSILDVTGDSITEVASVDLPGNQDGLSIFVLGRQLYFGRQSNVSGPELYTFDVSNPSSLSLASMIGQGEVGADVHTIKVTGPHTFVGTSKSGQEFQVWSADYSTWDGGVLNAGRMQSHSFSNLAPLGIDIDGDWIYGISQNAGSDSLQVLYRP